MRPYPLRLALLGLCLAVAMGGAVRAEEPYQQRWSGFATSLVGRSGEQRGNAVRAGAALDGAVIPPGGIFSFNDLVGARDRSKGYGAAPMIDPQGLLQDVPGGGVCQLAGTVYNAALLAGLEVVERHPHSRPVATLPPGRDATIASWRKDLKLRNPHPVPLRLTVAALGDRLTASFWGHRAKEFTVAITTDTIPVAPETVAGSGHTGPRQAGKPGYSVVTHRILTRGETVTDQVISTDFYPPATRILEGP